jgi:hypothetical protein
MQLARFCPVGRDGPDTVVKVELAPVGKTQLARAGIEQREQLQGRLGFDRALIRPDGPDELRKPLAVGHGPVLDLGRYQRALQRYSRITVCPGRCDGVAKDLAGTFTTIPFFNNPCCLGGNTVQGGTLEYEETLFNIGVVLSPFTSGLFSGTDFFAGFSQGFTVNDFGRALRATTVGSIEAFAVEAQVIDSYEIGVRSDFGKVQTSLVGYVSESELGSSFNAATLELVRAPEEVWGLEFSLDAQPSDKWRWGSSVAWIDGETPQMPQV